MEFDFWTFFFAFYLVAILSPEDYCNEHHDYRGDIRNNMNIV